MIATCPHCQSGFYIASDLAGTVVACSKCKKQVRAPDRRSGGLGPSEQANDGIPTAILAENRVEVEERLKAETEGRFDAERKLKEAMEAKTRADQQAKVDSQARQEAEERLKIEVQARAAMEARLLTETQARVRAEEMAMAEGQARAGLETQLKAEIEARSKADAQLESTTRKVIEAEMKLKDTVRNAREVELKLKDEEVARMKAESRADSEAEARIKTEQRSRAEVEARAEAESQAKMEKQAKHRAQIQMEEELKARKKAEEALEAATARLRNAIAPIIKEPVDFNKGLKRLTIVLSFVTAWLGGWFAYINGYIIWSRFDRPVPLPWFKEPVCLPLVLIAFCIAGFAAAWVVYLAMVFVIKGFHQPTEIIEEKRQRRSEPQPGAGVKQLVSAGGQKEWRSS